MLFFDKPTVTFGLWKIAVSLYKLDVSPDSQDLNKRRPTILVKGPTSVVDANGRNIMYWLSGPTNAVGFEFSKTDYLVGPPSV